MSAASATSNRFRKRTASSMTTTHHKVKVDTASRMNPTSEYGSTGSPRYQPNSSAADPKVWITNRHEQYGRQGHEHETDTAPDEEFWVGHRA